MEAKYITILDFTNGVVNIIKLTPEEIEASNNYEDFEVFLSTLEEKYGFRTSNCQWMVSETLELYRYEDGVEVSHESEL